MAKKADKPIRYGGQALMEGVMMQGPQGYAMAVRTPDNQIVYKHGQRKSIKERYKILNIPVLRGLVSFVESMYVGFSSLTWSAFQAGESESDKLTWKEIAFAFGAAMILSILLFVVLPVFVASFSLERFGVFGRSLIEGLLRIGLFVGYVLIIRRIPDVARIFEYHGAEHKTINALEAGLPLTVENVQKQSCINCRCGSSFVLMSMILMVVVFTFFGNTNVIGRIFTKIAMMPLVMGIAYEFFRLPLYFPNSKLVKILVTPGLWLQRLTTKEPTPEEIEVAMVALGKTPGFVLAGGYCPRAFTEEEYASQKEAEESDLVESPIIEIGG